MTEPWDPVEVERGWRDALAILGEYVPSEAEVFEIARAFAGRMSA